MTGNCDSYARILAMAALAAAEQGGGGGGVGIQSVYIADGHLHIVFTSGDDSDVGQVVGENGKCYVPHITDDEEGNHKLSWTIEDRAGENPPDPVLLGYPSGEWGTVDGTGEVQEFEWDDLNDGQDDE